MVFIALLKPIFNNDRKCWPRKAIFCSINWIQLDLKSTCKISRARPVGRCNHLSQYTRIATLVSFWSVQSPILPLHGKYLWGLPILLSKIWIVHVLIFECLEMKHPFILMNCNLTEELLWAFNSAYSPRAFLDKFAWKTTPKYLKCDTFSILWWFIVPFLHFCLFYN